MFYFVGWANANSKMPTRSGILTVVMRGTQLLLPHGKKVQGCQHWQSVRILTAPKPIIRGVAVPIIGWCAPTRVANTLRRWYLNPATVRFRCCFPIGTARVSRRCGFPTTASITKAVWNNSGKSRASRVCTPKTTAGGACKSGAWVLPVTTCRAMAILNTF